MYNSLQLALKYFQYYLNASNGKGHGIHSPFVFDFIQNVLNNKNNYFPPHAVENYRKELLADNRRIQVEDYGAGSRSGAKKTKSIKEIAISAVKPGKYSQLLFRLVTHYQPQTIIELGTSLGLTTSYFSLANPNSTIITIEGSNAIASIAKETFFRLSRSNIEVVNGNFDMTLPTALSRFQAIDLAYIDGNHRYAPTINYFEEILSRSDNNTILVFDDIYWSAEMEKAWEEIKCHPAVKCTIDIFFLGFVFLRSEIKEKQHYKIRY